MKKEFLDNDYLLNVSYLQYLLYLDKNYTIKDIDKIKELVKELIKILEKGR